MEQNWLNIISLLLVIIGGINWGLIGLFNFDIVAFIFGNMSMISRIIYTIIGIAAIYSCTLFKQISK